MKLFDTGNRYPVPASLIQEVYDLLDPVWKHVLNRVNFEVYLLNPVEAGERSHTSGKESFYLVPGANNNVNSCIVGCWDNFEMPTECLPPFYRAVLSKVVSEENGWTNLFWQISFLDHVAWLIFRECREWRQLTGTTLGDRVFIAYELSKWTLRSRIDQKLIKSWCGDKTEKFLHLSDRLKTKLGVA